MPIDAFKTVRENERTIALTHDNGNIPMLLRYKDVRKAAKNWQIYSSNAPFRVPIPSEENVRSVRQLPIEIDPPEHKVYRDLVEPFFRNPHNPEYCTQIGNLIHKQLLAVCAKDEVDVVREFALPIQSRALAYLLGLPESEAETWIEWGTHVFRDGDDPSFKGSVLESYLRQALHSAIDRTDQTDIFSYLMHSTVNERPLTWDEALGIVNLIFAGGRDTIINAISSVIGYFASKRDELMVVGSVPLSINLAVEEFIRVVSPLTHIGRVTSLDTTVGNRAIAKSTRVSLCWAAANYDPDVFDNPETINLQRTPNPHVGFGSGPHSCLGAIQARVILRSLIRELAERTSQITIIQSQPNIENYGSLQREVGYDKLTARVQLRK